MRFSYGLVMTRSRLAVLPIALLIAGTALTGCGSSASDSGAASPSASSLAAGSDSSGDAVKGADLAKRVQESLIAAGTFKTKTDSDAAKGESSNVIGPDGKAASQSTMDAGGAPLEIIALNDGAETYLKAPSLQIATWTKVEANSSNPMIAAMAGTLDTMKGAMSPTASLALYAEADDFTKAGVETIDGVTTTKYTGTIPGSAMSEMVSSAAGPSSSMPAVKDSPVEIWLDDKDQPIKVVTTTDMSGKSLTTTVTYSDFGSPIKVEAPQAGS